MKRTFTLRIASILWILSLMLPRNGYAQFDYFNTIAIRGGWIEPSGAYSRSLNSYDNHLTGLNGGYSFGIEWKTRMLVFDLLQEEISNAFFSNSGGQSPFGLILGFDQNRFRIKQRDESPSSGIYDKVQVAKLLEVSKVNLGIFYTVETESEDFFVMLKLSGGVGQIKLPEINYTLSGLKQFNQNGQNMNTSHVVSGVDLVYDMNWLRFQIQYDLTWMRPEIRTTTRNFVNGSSYYQSSNETFWSHGINLSVGVNF